MVVHPRRSPRPLMLLALVVTLLVLGACTGQRTVPTKYGETTRENFQEGCVDALRSESGTATTLTTDAAGDVCRCAYRAISGEGGIPFSEFKAINERLEENPGPLPESITSLVEECQNPT